MLAFGEGGDFWGDVAWSAASVENVVLAVSVSREAEICNDRHEARVSSQHDVLRLDVPMHDSIIVHLLQSHCHSLDELLDLS